MQSESWRWVERRVVGREDSAHPTVLVASCLIALSSMLCAAGCGGASRDYRQYVPDAASARKALETALAAWQRGEPPGKIESASPPIQVVDTKRPQGRKLARFEIVKEESDDGPRWFSVRLTFEGPNGAEEARYAVVGDNPIWVFRDSDYAQVGSM